MNTSNKNLLIGGLIVIVLVMAVGYAAFATQLNITGTANITSTWDVHFDKASKVNSDIRAEKTFSGGNLPSGTLTYGEGNAPLTATVHANLNQPGDSVTFTLRIINAGTLSATSAAPTLSGTGFTINGLTAIEGHVKYTVTAPLVNPLPASGLTTMTVKATFIDTITGTCSNSNYTTKEACQNASGTWTEAADGEGVTGNMASETGSTLTIALNYSQTA